MSGAAAAPATPSAFRSALRPVEQDARAKPGARRRSLSAESAVGARQSAREDDAPEALAQAVAAALLPQLQALCPGGAAGAAAVGGELDNQLAARLRCLELLEERARQATDELERLAEAAAALPLATAPQPPPEVPQGPEGPLSPCGRLMTNQASAKPRRYRHSSTSGVGGVHQEFLEKAFVVNFRRLMIILKVCEIIHELIKSTGIAALTLVGAFNLWELSYSILFVAILMFLFVFNIRRMHTMDGDKYKRLADLLEDDDPDPNTNGGQWRNPNRYLKALMLQRRGRCLRRLGRRRRAFLGTSLVALLCGAAWGLLVWEWATDDAFEDERWGGEESMRFYSALLLIGTLMFLFYVAFEAMYWRETQSVMPMKWDGAKWVPWDVKYDGVPPQFRWFGLPSMWFSSQKAKSDLILWSSLATTTHEQRSAGRTVDKLYPEELAVLSLDSRVIGQLRGALKNAKLFQCESKCGGGRFLTRRDRSDLVSGELSEPRKVDRGEVPEELGVQLIFYDAQNPAYSVAEEASFSGSVHLLRGRSLVSSATGSPAARSAASSPRSLHTKGAASPCLNRGNRTPREQGLLVRFNSKDSECNFDVFDAV
ncbi:unnamed protein product [Prorocentrum cordatum]|uniref:Autophagy-related protein 9 n=1 Tax=Prorocentrum cordatum TaxID=2364126 RepID=A0ABN9RCI8_9DINO|nr:unnamed protein product [Polarella glacialis]